MCSRKGIVQPRRFWPGIAVLNKWIYEPPLLLAIYSCALEIELCSHMALGHSQRCSIKSDMQPRRSCALQKKHVVVVFYKGTAFGQPWPYSKKRATEPKCFRSLGSVTSAFWNRSYAFLEIDLCTTPLLASYSCAQERE